MKYLFKQILSVLLVIVMVASTATVAVTSVSAAEDYTSTVGFSGTALAKTALTRVGGRLFKEFTSYCISNEVPVLGSAFYILLCDPATRSTMTMKGEVKQILADVTQIKQDVNTVLQDLDKIYEEIKIIDSENKYASAKEKIDMYLVDAPTVQGYQALWTKYQASLDYFAAADEARTALATETDSAKIEELNLIIAENEAAAESEMESFVALYQDIFFADNESKDYSYDKYAKDMNNISKYICTESKNNTEYLPALENMLRIYYPYEHQITEQMLAGFEYCEMVQYQMYLIHREYASYCEAKKYAASSSDEAPQLPEDFFAKENALFEENIEQQILNSGIHTLMVTEPLEEDEGETTPYVFDTTFKIGGEDVPAYIIRDNESLSYYVITQEAEKASDLIDYREEQWDNLTDVRYYWPSGMLDTQYTDNGEFKMISSLSEVNSLTANPLNYLRSDAGAGLEKISESTDSILLYNYDFLGIQSNDDIEWNMKFANARTYDENHPDANVNTYSSQAVYEGEAKDKTYIKIYKSIYNDALFEKDNTLKVNDYESMPKLIALHDGQTFDYSKVTVSPGDCTIVISGEATVIGNPDVTLNNSQIIICTDEQVTLKDVNVEAVEYKSAVEVRANNAKINFNGTNTFTGNGGAVDLETMVMLDTNNYNPVGASHGMLINNDASVTLTGATATFNGDAGGAGICTWGDLIIDNATIIANGSYEKLNSYYGLYEEFKAPVYSVGAGIGASAVAVKNSTNSTVYLNEKLILGRTYAEYGTVTIKNKSDVTAEGAYPEGDESGSYASDIGGVRYVKHIEGEDALGWIPTDITYTYGSCSIGGGNISDSKVNVYRGNIDSNIKQSNNTYDYTMDTYTITTCTAGSDGVTADKLEFYLIGNEGTSNGIIRSSKCGNNQGTYTITADMGYIGTELLAIEIEIDGNDGWYPEYINVKSEHGKINQTFYGGRWLDDSKTITLKPSDNVFKIDIKTADVSKAGTDAAVYVQLIDSNGKTSSKIDVADVHPLSNAFEQDDSMSVYMYAPDDFSKLQYIQINTDPHGTASANWKIEKLGSTQVSGANKGDSFSITVNQWDPNGKTMSFGRETGKSGTFEFDIKTQNKLGAGTDATIKFKLIGTNGETNLVDVESFIDNYTSGDNFEKNDHDKGRITFQMPAGGIGTITGIYVQSSGGAASADWDLEYIDITEIVPGGTGQHVKFNANCTIKKNSSKTLTKPTVYKSSAIMSSPINREVLEKLEMTGEDSYLLSVNEPVTISSDVFELLRDNSIVLTVEMMEDTDILYSITFDGEKIQTCKDVKLGKDYDIRDRETLVSFLENSNIPEGTKLNIYLNKLGFTENDSVSLYEKGENGQWTMSETQLTDSEIYQEIEITDGDDLLIRAEDISVSGKDESASVDKDTVLTSSSGSVISILLIITTMGLTMIIIGLYRKKKQH